MANEETYLQNLLANRKIVRNYIETTKEFPELKKVIDLFVEVFIMSYLLFGNILFYATSFSFNSCSNET